MGDLEEKLIKLCEGIRDLVNWASDLRACGETHRAIDTSCHINEMIRFACRIPAKTARGRSAKTDALAAIDSRRDIRFDDALVRALRASIENDERTDRRDT